jgi:hypothetical protein
LKMKIFPNIVERLRVRLRMRSLVFFTSPNPSSLTTALGSTWTLTERSIRNLPGNKGRPVCKDDNLTAIYELIIKKMWGPRRLTTLCASTVCYRYSFTYNNYQHSLGGKKKDIDRKNCLIYVQLQRSTFTLKNTVIRNSAILQVS